MDVFPLQRKNCKESSSVRPVRLRHTMGRGSLEKAVHRWQKWTTNGLKLEREDLKWSLVIHQYNNALDKTSFEWSLVEWVIWNNMEGDKLMWYVDPDLCSVRVIRFWQRTGSAGITCRAKRDIEMSAIVSLSSIIYNLVTGITIVWHKW